MRVMAFKAWVLGSNGIIAGYPFKKLGVGGRDRKLCIEITLYSYTINILIALKVDIYSYIACNIYTNTIH